MKLIIAAIKPFKLEEVREALTSIGVRGMMVTEIKGFGSQSGHTEIYRGAEYAVNFVPKVKLEIVVAASMADQVVETIQTTAKTDKIGDGKIFVLDVQSAVRVRTGETNDDRIVSAYQRDASQASETYLGKLSDMKTKYLLPVLGAAAIVLPSMAVAQDEAALHTSYILTTLLFLVGGFLVFWMAAGFAMLEAGLVRSKNVAMQLTKNIALFSIAAIMYWLVGFGIMYPAEWLIEGWLGPFFAITSLEPVGLEGVETALDYASVGSDFFFQLMFCATTASIVSGTLAERIKLWPFLIFVVVLTGFIYPIEASWQWGQGWLYNAGFSDFAGSTLVHAAGGFAALAGAIVLGPRLGKYKDGRVNPMPGSNLALATLGTFILWLGWFGFNGGSQLAMGTIGDVADVSRIFANTNMAAAAGAVAALILTQIMYGKVDLTMVLNGALAGLVSITAEPLAPSLFGSLLTGAVGGLIVVVTVPLLDKLKIDDVVGAIPVHLFAGVWGTLAVAFYTGNWGAQILGIAAIGVFVFVTSLVVWFILHAIVGIRVGEEEEINGLDVAELGMEAYPEFSKG